MFFVKTFKGAKCLKLWPALFALVWLLFAGTDLVSGQGGQFTAEAEHAFGQKIVFTLTAVTDLHTSQATLFIREVGQLGASHQVEVPLVPSASEANHFTAVYEFDPHSEQVNILPFAEVEYWWELAGDDGQSVIVPPKTIRYDDNRFEWQQADTDQFRFFWTGEGLAVGETAVAVFESIWPDLYTIMPLPISEPQSVYIYPSLSDLRTSLNLTNQPFDQGHIDPALGVALVTVVNDKTAEKELKQNLPHALTHLLLYKLAGAETYAQMPFWFKEGLALHFESDQKTRQKILDTAVTNQQLLPLTELCQPDVEVEQLLIAQAQAVSMIRFVHNQYGDRALSDLADAFVRREDCATAVESALGQSLAQFENSWLRAQKSEAVWQQFIIENSLWLLLILVGFIIMGLLIWQPQKR